MSRGLPKGTQAFEPRRRPDERALLDDLLGKGARLVSLNVSLITPNPEQARKDVGDLSELTASIREKGILEPLVVRKLGEGYQIIAGERRYRAFMKSGRADAQLPCVLVEADDQEALEISLIENLQRKDLDVLEEADAYRKMQSELGYTVEQIARKIGKSIGHVSSRLAVARLPEGAKGELSKVENLPRHVAVEATRAEKAGKLTEYLQMVQRGEIASAKEATCAADRLSGKRPEPQAPWQDFRYGRFRSEEDGRGGFVVTIATSHRKFHQWLVSFLERAASATAEPKGEQSSLSGGNGGSETPACAPQAPREKEAGNGP